MFEEAADFEVFPPFGDHSVIARESPRRTASACAFVSPPRDGADTAQTAPKTVSGEKAVFTIPDSGKYSSAALPLTIIEELFAEVMRTRAVAVFSVQPLPVYCPSAFALILLIR